MVFVQITEWQSSNAMLLFFFCFNHFTVCQEQLIFKTNTLRGDPKTSKVLTLLCR